MLGTTSLSHNGSQSHPLQWDAEGRAGHIRHSPATVGVIFAIYKQQDGGAPVWQETQNVTLDANGNYSVLLGSTTATGLPGDLFSQQEQRWLGVQVQGQPEQARVLLVSVPYAMKANEADRLAGHAASEFVTSDTLQSAVQQQLQQQSGAASSPAATAGSGNSAKAVTKAADTDGPTNFSGSTDDQIVGVTQSGSRRRSEIFGGFQCHSWEQRLRPLRYWRVHGTRIRHWRCRSVWVCLGLARAARSE